MKTAWGCGAVKFLQYFLWFGNQSVGMFAMTTTETPCHDCRESERHRRTAMKLYSEGIQPRLWKSETKNRSSVAQGCKISYGVHVPNSRMMGVSLSLSLRVLMRMHSLKMMTLYHLYLRVAGGAVNQEALQWVVQDLPWETSLPSLQSWFVFSTLVSSCKDSRMLPVTVSRLH